MKNDKQNAGHSPEYDDLVPSAIFDIEDSDEIAEIWLDTYGYDNE